jgi:Mg-chelatase subunit ChlD
MNPEIPSTPRAELEVQITALLLGELPAAHALALRELIARDPELAALHNRLSQAIGLLKSCYHEQPQAANEPVVEKVGAAAQEPARETAGTSAPVTLSDQRRQKLLAQFKTVAPKEFKKPLRQNFRRVINALAVAAIIMLLVAISVPNFIKARSTSQSNAVQNNLRQIDGAMQQWALEKKLPPTARPTFEDIMPYMGRGTADQMPASVMGETYELGTVADRPVARKGGKVMDTDGAGWVAASAPDSSAAARGALSTKEADVAYAGIDKAQAEKISGAEYLGAVGRATVRKDGDATARADRTQYKIVQLGDAGGGVPAQQPVALNSIVLPSSDAATASTPPAQSQNQWGLYDNSTAYREINNKDQWSANGGLGGVSGQPLQESKIRELGRENFGANLGAGSVDRLKESAAIGGSALSSDSAPQPGMPAANNQALGFNFGDGARAVGDPQSLGILEAQKSQANVDNRGAMASTPGALPQGPYPSNVYSMDVLGYTSVDPSKSKSFAIAPLGNAQATAIDPSTGLPVVANRLVGDPDWAGVLERPGFPHSTTNRFVSRYAYLGEVQPSIDPATGLPVAGQSGKSLDLSGIANQVDQRKLQTGTPIGSAQPTGIDPSTGLPIDVNASLAAMVPLHPAQPGGGTVVFSNRLPPQNADVGKDMPVAQPAQPPTTLNYALDLNASAVNAPIVASANQPGVAFSVPAAGAAGNANNQLGWMDNMRSKQGNSSFAGGVANDGIRLQLDSDQPPANAGGTAGDTAVAGARFYRFIPGSGGGGGGGGMGGGGGGGAVGGAGGIGGAGVASDKFVPEAQRVGGVGAPSLTAGLPSLATTAATPEPIAAPAPAVPPAAYPSGAYYGGGKPGQYSAVTPPADSAGLAGRDQAFRGRYGLAPGQSSDKKGAALLTQKSMQPKDTDRESGQGITAYSAPLPVLKPQITTLPAGRGDAAKTGDAVGKVATVNGAITEEGMKRQLSEQLQEVEGRAMRKPTEGRPMPSRGESDSKKEAAEKVPALGDLAVVGGQFKADGVDGYTDGALIGSKDLSAKHSPDQHAAIALPQAQSESETAGRAAGAASGGVPALVQMIPSATQDHVMEETLSELNRAEQRLIELRKKNEVETTEAHEARQQVDALRKKLADQTSDLAAYRAAGREVTTKQHLANVDEAWSRLYDRTNLIFTGTGQSRQQIQSKLDNVRLGELKYDGLPLGEVLNDITAKARKGDSEGKGLNFLLNQHVDTGATGAVGPIDPATGLPTAAAAPPEPVDLNASLIKFPPLHDLTLGQALDAIVRNSEVPLKYSVEDYGIVFSKDESRAAQQKVADLAIRHPSTNSPIPQPEIASSENPFSTFSLNVSDVSFKLAGASLEKGVMPDPASVRSEEFINAFDYHDPEAPAGVPIAFAWERARYPFAQNRDLLRFSLKTAAQGRQPGRPFNIVLLLDNSGSMERADRVSIIQQALRVLASQLQPQDKFSVVTFARTPRLWVDGVPGDQAGKVSEEMGKLTPGGGTNLEEAMNLAYQTALRHYQANGVNRVVLLTDGAANLGDVEPESLKKKVEACRKQGVALDCFGIGWEGYNDDLLEVLSRNGDGRYGFLNTPEEATTEFAAKLAGALQVAAADVKVQVEFNAARVKAYRQIGYAKHQLTKEQFRDNTVDAAEIGAAEAGNALYVIEVDPAGSGPLAMVRVRFRIPNTNEFREHEWAVPFSGVAEPLDQSSPALRLAATASAFSEWLAASPFAAEVSPDRLIGLLGGVPNVYSADARPKKLEWMIRQAKSLEGK